MKPIRSRPQRLNIKLQRFVPWGEGTAAWQFYDNVSTLVRARIESIGIEHDPVVGGDCLFIDLRLIEGRPGAKVLDVIDLSGLDGAHVRSFVQATGAPPDATRARFDDIRMFRGFEVLLRYTTTLPVGQGHLANRVDGRLVYVVHASYASLDDL